MFIYKKSVINYFIYTLIHICTINRITTCKYFVHKLRYHIFYIVKYLEKFIQVNDIITIKMYILRN